MSDIPSMNFESKDLVAERIIQIKELFPEVITEGEGSIDFEKLRLLLGDEVNEGDERYAFTWPGKADAVRQAQTVSTATLRPCPEKSVNWDTTENLYIEGDNLEVLKLLQRGYHGKVKLIYIDPPYNTGHDFIYQDSFGDSVSNYKNQAGLIGQSNADTSGRFHSDWCSMMYPRLKLARELLSDDGAIFISIDDNELNNLISICNEVFGEANRVGYFVWKRRTSSAMDSHLISIDHEYVLCYSKQPDLTFLGLDKDYSNYSNPDNDPRGPWTLGDLTVGMTGDMRPNQYYDLIDPDTGIIFKPNFNRVWSYTPESMEKLINDGRVVFPKDPQKRPMKKRFANELKSKKDPFSSWMSNVGLNTEGTKSLSSLFNGVSYFSYAKPLSLLKLLVRQLIDDEGIVLDFFSGSGSTAQAVMELNAEGHSSIRYIQVQLPEVIPVDNRANVDGYRTITEIGEERIRRAGKKIAEEIEESNRQLKLGEEPMDVPDIGFRVLKLDESGIMRPDSGQLVLDRIKPDRTEEDIIFEMMLKWGLELTNPIEKTVITGYPCYSVAGNALICCMQEGLTVETIQAIADRLPNRVLMLDSILDDTLKLNAVQIIKHVEAKNQITIDLRTV